jgi:iron-sulfur cluster assembly protein
MSISITDLAKQKLQQALSSQDSSYFVKIAALSGGCSGFKYHLGLDQKQETDILLEIDGLNVLVTEGSLPLLNGVVLDYRQELFSEGFSFSNSNAHSCGCGSSFRPKDSDECETEL